MARPRVPIKATKEEIKKELELVIVNNRTLEDVAGILDTNIFRVRMECKEIFGMRMSELQKIYKNETNGEKAGEEARNCKIVKCCSCGKKFKTEIDKMGVAYLMRCPRCTRALKNSPYTNRGSWCRRGEVNTTHCKSNRI